MSAQPEPHLSPAQAARVAGVSRWAILRAIKGEKLKAIRDNRNNWRITQDDLAAWRAAHGAHTVRGGATAHHDAHPDVVADLRENLAVALARVDAAERARDQAEAERDRWRAMAEKLAEKPRLRWWPFWRDP